MLILVYQNNVSFQYPSKLQAKTGMRNKLLSASQSPPCLVVGRVTSLHWYIDNELLAETVGRNLCRTDSTSAGTI